MRTLRLPVYFTLLAAALLCIPDTQLWGQVLDRSPVAVISDQPGYADSSNSAAYDLGQVIPAQFQSRAATPARTPARTAGLSTSRQAPQSFNIRLARAPKMLGDFFGLAGVPTMTEAFVGRAVHHTTSINDIHLIDETGSVVTYLGGPDGDIPGSFFVPGPPPPAPALITGLSSNIPGNYYAAVTSDVVDVYNDPMDFDPDLFDAEVYEVFQIVDIIVPNPSAGDIVGRVRMQDNNSAMPQDRVYFDYNFFHNARLVAGGLDLNRFSPGVEKTFFNGLTSVELRVPMGISLDNNVLTNGPLDTSNYELGNVVVAPKLLLHATEDFAFAIGMGVSLPTADDLNIGMVDGTRLVSIENESVHLLPYLAYLYTPVNSNCFMHYFLTYDVDTNGNPAFANVNGTGLEPIGTINDQNVITMDLALGSWLYQSQNRNDRLQGVAWTGELHYNATVNDADAVTAGTYTIGNPNADLSLLNATVGGHVRLGLTTFTAGYSVPLTSSDRVFDGEFRFFVNRLY